MNRVPNFAWPSKIWIPCLSLSNAAATPAHASWFPKVASLSDLQDVACLVKLHDVACLFDLQDVACLFDLQDVACLFKVQDVACLVTSAPSAAL